MNPISRFNIYKKEQNLSDFLAMNSSARGRGAASSELHVRGGRGQRDCRKRKPHGESSNTRTSLHRARGRTCRRARSTCADRPSAARGTSWPPCAGRARAGCAPPAARDLRSNKTLKFTVQASTDCTL